MPKMDTRFNQIQLPVFREIGPQIGCEVEAARNAEGGVTLRITNLPNTKTMVLIGEPGSPNALRLAPGESGTVDFPLDGKIPDMQRLAQ